MSAKEFDESLKSKLAEADFAFNPDDYAAMAQKLVIARRSNPSRRILLLLLSTAACIAFALAIPGIIRITENTANTVTIATTEKETIPSSVLENKATPKKENSSTNNLADITPKHSAKLKATRNLQNSLSAQNPTANINSIVAAPGANKTTQAAIADGPGKNKNLAKDIPMAQNTFHLDVPLPTERENNYNRKLNISLGGGVNYGSSSQGYAIAASARKNISNKLYVEGDLAYLNTTAHYTSTTSVGQPSTFAGFKPVTVNNLSTFNYLQLSPTMGYHLHKKLAVAVGPDFQRLLQSNATTATASTSDGDKIAPDMDFGFIGKTEYAVYQRLKAGFLYREGMNNFLTNTNKYLERNYFQVQLKYSLSNK